MTEETPTSGVPASSSYASVPAAPHSTSMVVWEVPSPAAVSTPATVKVGVQCAVGCCLSGQMVEVRDQTGAAVGTGTLGSAPLSGIDALYWADVTFMAPATTGVSFLLAAFARPNLEVPHMDAGASFSLRTEALPEHRVTIRVVHQITEAPIEKVEVRMNHYAACTDERGEAHFYLPGGGYTCSIRKMGYKADPVELEVVGDFVAHLKAGVGETREELEARLSAWEDYPWG